MGTPSLKLCCTKLMFSKQDTVWFLPKTVGTKSHQAGRWASFRGPGFRNQISRPYQFCECFRLPKHLLHHGGADYLLTHRCQEHRASQPMAHMHLSIMSRCPQHPTSCWPHLCAPR